MSEKKLDASAMGAKGGRARAQAMTPEERSEAARKAVEARWAKSPEVPQCPKAISEGTLKIGDAEIPCAVIEGNIRVISQRGMSAALGRHVTGSGSSGSKGASERGESGVAKLPNFLRASNLKPFIDLDLAASLSEPVAYIPLHGGRSAYGFKAELFPKICDVWLRAKDAGKLKAGQIETAQIAYVLMRGLAHVGIIALVDEATGFQDIRARDALAKILEQFVAKELRPYVKCFEVEWFKDLCRIRHLPFPKDMRLPPYFGHLVNDIVYSRLAPGIVAELKKKNPVRENGRRKNKNFQWLTEEVGHPKLKEHIKASGVLMKVFDDYEAFYSALNKALPKQIQWETPLFDLDATSSSELPPPSSPPDSAA